MSKGFAAQRVKCWLHLFRFGTWVPDVDERPCARARLHAPPRNPRGLSWRGAYRLSASTPANLGVLENVCLAGISFQHSRREGVGLQSIWGQKRAGPKKRVAVHSTSTPSDSTAKTHYTEAVTIRTGVFWVYYAVLMIGT